MTQTEYGVVYGVWRDGIDNYRGVSKPVTKHLCRYGVLLRRISYEAGKHSKPTSPNSVLGPYGEVGLRQRRRGMGGDQWMSFVPGASRSACSPASSPSTTALICRAMVYTRCWLFQIKASSWQDIRSTYSKRRKRKSLRPLSASWRRGTTPTARPHGWPSHFVRTRSQPSITVINKNMSMSVSLAASRSKCPRPLFLYILHT